jgi:hypothetical protein
MSKKLFFISFIIGALLYETIKYSIGFGLDPEQMLTSIYWSGATLLAYHSLEVAK